MPLCIVSLSALLKPIEAKEHKKNPAASHRQGLGKFVVVNDPLPPDASQGYEYYYHKIDLVDEVGSNGLRGVHES